MSPARLSISRAVAPLRRPEIAALLDLFFDRVPILAFAAPREAKLVPDQLPRSLAAQLPRCPISRVSSDPLAEPLILDMPSPAGLPAELVSIPVELDVGEPAGGRVPRPGVHTAPPQLAVAQRPGIDDRTAEGFLGHLRPRLEPPILTEDGEPALYTWPVRPYQVQAVRALMTHGALLLADDPGMGKTVAACLALLARFQGGQAKRSLVVCSEQGGHRHWAAHLAGWAGGLTVSLVWGQQQERQAAWARQAHVYVVDYPTLASDIEAGVIKADRLQFDLMILDAVPAMRRAEGQRARAVERVQAKQRWALAGGIPRQAEDWLAIFSLLSPGLTKAGSGETLPDLKTRFKGMILRRTKSEVASELPALVREEVWLDLDERLAQAYGELLAEERHRLERLGRSLSLTHVTVAVDRLNQTANFIPDSLDGPKVRALVDLVEEIGAAQGKVVVFSQYRREALDRLMPVMEAYGALRLEAPAPEEVRAKVVRAFRQEPGRRVLLADLQARTDGESLNEASYIVHFDHGWNPAVRQRAEARLHPPGKARIPVTVYEFWMAGTIDERLHSLLGSRGLLPGQVVDAEAPAAAELHLDDWMSEILQVGQRAEAADGRQPAGSKPVGMGAFPATDILKTKLADLSREELQRGVQLFMQALGFGQVQPLGEPAEDGGYVIAARRHAESEERILVRYVRSSANVGVAEARPVLDLLDHRGDCLGAYILATTDFSASCRKLAEESAGKLALVSGVEFYRHLHILGLL